MPLVNGIWKYDESDTVSPTYSEHLNKLGDSVRNALAVVQSDSGNVPIAAAAGFTSSNARARRKGTRVLCGGSMVTAGPLTLTTEFKPLGTVPETGQVRPVFSGGNYTVSVLNFGAVQISVSVFGVVLIRAVVGSMALPSGVTIALDGIGWEAG